VAILKNIIVFFLFFNIVFTQSNQQGEILSETPLHPIPEEMTYDEYQDMNRRMNIGIGLAFIPIPGIVHRYAGEKKTAKILSYSTLGGLLALIASSGKEERKWSESDYELFILNEGLDNETRYEKIPIEIAGNDSITYKLNQVYKEISHTGGNRYLGLIGFAAIFGSYYYDVFHGLKKIHDKREAVRFKYGKQLKYSLRPSYDPLVSKTKLNLDFYF
tara:strand:+ start:335 stop:985 length:651 start_codon:yes stop_codon:yes gene_type:complete